MTNATPSKKRRRPGRKAADIRLVWKEQAPEATLAGKTLAEFETAITAVEMSTQELKIKGQAHSAAVKMRDDKLKSLAALLRTVVRGVQSHPEHGEDSPPYRAMGYVTLSERRSGLARRKKSGAANGTDGQEETAA